MKGERDIKELNGRDAHSEKNTQRLNLPQHTMRRTSLILPPRVGTQRKSG